MDVIRKPHQEQQSPFMKLSTEIRQVVYQLAFQEFIDMILDLAPNRKLLHDDPCVDAESHFATNSSHIAYKFLPGGRSAPIKGPPFLGPLALLHASFIIRSESSCVMPNLVKSRYKIVRAELDCIESAYFDARGFSKRIRKRIGWEEADSLDAMNYDWKVKKIMETLEDVVRSIERNSAYSLPHGQDKESGH